MFHPNFYANGSICLDILQNQWSPIYDVAVIFISIQDDVVCLLPPGVFCILVILAGFPNGVLFSLKRRFAISL